ncbi:MAG: glycosyltransferase family 4 protein [Ignavibacteriales bacterium]|nr:glycosyltransferase family 4 protein [Ignavibacteriales bacterium]
MQVLSVLHLQPSLNLACGITRMLYQITRFSETFSRHIIFYLDGNAITKFTEAEIELVKLPGTKNPLYTLYQIWFIVRFCKKNNISILTAHHRYFDIAGKIASLFLQIPVVTVVHSKVYNKRHLSYFADKFIAPAENIKKHLENRFHVRPDKITVINNFIVPEDYKLFDDEALRLFRLEQGLPENKKIVLFMSRWSKEKGIDVLLSAMKTILREDSSVFFVIAGDGEEKQSVVEFGKEFTGRCRVIASVINVAPWYQSADIVVLPSRVDPYPLTVIESGFFSKAIVASAVDGIAELIQHGQDGYLVHPENKQELINGLSKLLKEPDTRKKLGKNLHEKIMTNNLAKQKLPEYYSLYRSIV